MNSLGVNQIITSNINYIRIFDDLCYINAEQRENNPFLVIDYHQAHQLVLIALRMAL